MFSLCILVAALAWATQTAAQVPIHPLAFAADEPESSMKTARTGELPHPRPEDRQQTTERNLWGATEPISGMFTVQGTKLISPQGEPIKLSGWRVCARVWEHERHVSLADFKKWDSQRLLGNAQAVEIWWTYGTPDHPGERYPYLAGAYQKQNLPTLLNTLRAIAQSGSWIIPSIRVSYDGIVAENNTRTGTNTWQGWAHHRKLIYNEPVIVEKGPHAGTYGNHRDRFFAWLDWLIPTLLADEEIASRIAYWEMWHFFGHRHGGQISAADHDHYLDDFVPRQIELFRRHDSDRLLGISIHTSITRLLDRIEAGTWTPWNDKNWIFVYGGYGVHDMFFRDVGLKKTWPEQSTKPLWLPATREFNVEKLIRLTGHAVHCQEGPGIREWYRTTPIPEPQRTWLVGLFNLYNAKTNGFGFHDWPPTQARRADQPAALDETDFFNLTREALKGNTVR
jgi:hypothetical protein